MAVPEAPDAADKVPQVAPVQPVPLKEYVAPLLPVAFVTVAVSAWVLQIVLSCLDHLAILGEVVKVDETDPQRWRLTQPL